MTIECCSGVLWLVIVGFVIAFVLAFGIGANDVANSFGTSVGSKVLTLKQACILATIFEILGAILIGANVSGTIRKGIFNPEEFKGSETELMFGYVSALAGCCIWLIVATILNLPVSGTHSIVGATIGMALASNKQDIIKWAEVLKIVASWFISPLISGLVSLVFFLFIRRFILQSENPLKSGLRLLPAIYTLTIVVNAGGVLEASPALLGFDKIPGWGKIVIGVAIGVICYLVVLLGLVPRMRRQILSKRSEKEQELLRLEELGQNEGSAKDNVEKNSMAIQVDHIALILEEKLKNEKLVFQERDKRSSSTEMLDRKLTNSEKFQLESDKKSQPTDASHTIHADSHAFKKMRGNRRRLDSAPIHDNESDFSDDVNMTLSGYLHTIHTPHFKNQLNILRQQHPHRTNSSSDQSKTATDPNQANNSHKVPLFSKIFSQQQSTDSAHEESIFSLTKHHDDLNTTDKPLLSNNETKVGRFVKQPAADMNNNKEVVKTDISNTAVMEVDEDVKDIIDELPEKLGKKPKVEALGNTDPPEAAKLFSFLQILTAIFGSFAHGGNDVSNAIGPLIGLYLIYQDGNIHSKTDTPVWILFYGGVGISVGLWILGRRVIKTIGEDLTKITPSSGFVIELASAMTVLVASLFKIPVSTTHCKVGSVVFTGRVRAKQSVDWSLFRNIIIAWLVTVPVTGGIAAACQATLRAIFIK